MLRPSSLCPALRLQGRTQCIRTTRRSLFSQGKNNRIADDFDINKLNSKRRDYEQNRTAFLAAGAVAGIVSFVYTAWKLKEALDAQKNKENRVVKCDASIPTELFKTEAGEKRKVVLHDDQGNEIVPTGNSVVQSFPRTMDIKLPYAQKQSPPIAASISDNEGVGFALVGLGTRTVTFLGIEVYIVGFYVATQDVAKLQHYLVKKINTMATTLIPSEKDTLRKALLDPVEGEETWNSILKDAGFRSAFRIIPVKDTDFPHMRDGFVRAITARSQKDKEAYGDDAFGVAMKDFRQFFQRGKVPKQKELLLVRDDNGRLTITYNDGDSHEPKRNVLGVIGDERLSRLLWLNYLAGHKVASEEARKNITEGVMEFVERPVGTVAAQVL